MFKDKILLITGNQNIFVLINFVIIIKNESDNVINKIKF